jgi:hypothetical protein
VYIIILVCFSGRKLLRPRVTLVNHNSLPNLFYLSNYIFYRKNSSILLKMLKKKKKHLIYFYATMNFVFSLLSAKLGIIIRGVGFFMQNSTVYSFIYYYEWSV